MMQEMNPIEPYFIEKSIPIIIEEAENFGQGIAEAFVRLAEKLDNQGAKRDCYGMVLKKNEKMSYFAGFTELYEGEGESRGFPIESIPSGQYLCIRIENWNQKILQIGPTFDQILKSGKVNTLSPCIEFYRTETELLCMVQSI